MPGSIEERQLTPGKDVDVDVALDAYARGIPRHMTGSFHDLVKLVADRSMEVLYPFLLKAARETRDRTVSLGDGWSYEHQDSGNPWRPCLFVSTVEGGGYLVAFELDVKPSPEALAAFDPTIPVEREMGFNLNRMMARLDAEKRLIENGVTAGMPDPDSITTLKGAYVHLVRPPRAGLKEVGNLFPVSLKETLASVASDAYSGGRAIAFKPDSPRFKAGGGECLLTTGAFDALAVLGNVARHAAGHEAVAIRNEEVGARSVMTLDDKDWEVALLEAAVGCVYRDGGVPGDVTHAATARAWLHGVTMAVPRMVENLEEARVILDDKGHSTRNALYECNDGRDGMWVESGPDGAMDAYMRSQHGTFLARRTEDAGGVSMAMARLGGPNGNSGLMPSNLALTHGSPGFLGRYLIGGAGGVSVVEPPRLGDHEIMAINGVTMIAATVAVSAEEDYGASALEP